MTVHRSAHVQHTTDLQTPGGHVVRRLRHYSPIPVRAQSQGPGKVLVFRTVSLVTIYHTVSTPPVSFMSDRPRQYITRATDLAQSRRLHLRQRS